jgi:hypothetical protein
VPSPHRYRLSNSCSSENQECYRLRPDRPPGHRGDPSSSWSRRFASAAGSRWAATDRRRDHRNPYRSMTDRRTGQAVAASFICGSSMILTSLQPSEVHPGSGSLDLTRKRSQVQTLSRPPGTTYLSVPHSAPLVSRLSADHFS